MLAAALDSVRDKVLAMALLQPGEKVIDLGASTGLLRLKATENLRLVREGPEGVARTLGAPNAVC